MYATNTIHIDSHVLAMNLPRLLLPARLALIRSIELIPTEVTLIPGGEEKAQQDLQDLVRAVSAALPNLQTFYLGFSWSACRMKEYWDPKDRKAAFKEHLWPTVEELILEVGKDWADIEVGVPHSSFWDIPIPRTPDGRMMMQARHVQDELKPKVQPAWYHERERRWKDLGDRGYWLSQSVDDEPPIPMVCTGF